MITKPTVIVLGAGVSIPYGFPSGSQLVREICGSTAGIHFEDSQPGLLNKGEITKILHNVFGELKAEEFGNALHFSQKYSIDAFLERRPEFTDIGKWAISLFILRREINANLFSFENQDRGCYRYLFDKLDTAWDEFGENKVSFITFNYDRSLEHFLFTTLQKTYGKNEVECAETIEQIPIIHVHGSLGKLPWQGSDNTSYGANLDNYREKLSVANGAASRGAKQIIVIPENQSTTEEYTKAFQLLSMAERIYFLGFSYHATNLERLKLHNLPQLISGREIIRGTGKGLEHSERKNVQNKWNIKIIDDSDSIFFLRSYAKLD